MAAEQRKVDELEREQAQLVQRLKKQLEDEGAAGDPRREELRRILAEIEKRMERSQKLYLRPSTKLTAEMEIYHARMLRKIEDCGTRNFPKRHGKSVYGKGLVAVTLDRNGKALETEILESSGVTLLDMHMAKLVRASSPFGALPPKVMLDEDLKPFYSVVILTSFNFEDNDQPVDPIDEKQRCKWP